MLLPLALYIDVSDVQAEEVASLRGLLRDLSGAVLVGCREPLAVPGRPFRMVDAPAPEPAPSKKNSGPRSWPASAGPADGLDAVAGRLSGEFDLNQAAIRRRRRRARRFSAAASGACGRPARRRPARGWSRSPSGRKPSATWNDLVLPDAETVLLRHLVDQVRGRATVLRHWGFAESISRGQRHHRAVRRPVRHRQDAGRRGHRRRAGAGPVPGRSVRRGEQVHRRDREEPAPGVRRRRARAARCCSSTRPTRCSGKRSEVKDSHDRYANIEVNYLLQRMEDYRGVAILTTNHAAALDQAFLRRLRFVVAFPFPSPRERGADLATSVPGPHTGRRSRPRPAARSWPRPAA